LDDVRVQQFFILGDFLIAADSVAASAEWAVQLMYELARMLATVKSHVSTQPLHHGINVKPSGCLPSRWMCQAGSVVARMPVAVKECQTAMLSV